MKRPRSHIDRIVKPNNTKRNYDSEYFKWCFKSCFHTHATWESMGACELINEIISKLEDYETQIWSQVKNASGGKTRGSNNHSMSASELPKELKKEYIKSKYMEKFDKVFSLRLTGKKRLIGYVNQGVFYVLWYDPNHQIFPCSA